MVAGGGVFDEDKVHKQDRDEIQKAITGRKNHHRQSCKIKQGGGGNRDEHEDVNMTVTLLVRGGGENGLSR